MSLPAESDIIPCSNTSVARVARRLPVGGGVAPSVRERALRRLSGIVLTTHHLDGGHHVEEIISTEEVGLHLEVEALERRAQRPNRIQFVPDREGGFGGMLKRPHHEGLVPDGSIDAIPRQILDVRF